MRVVQYHNNGIYNKYNTDRHPASPVFLYDTVGTVYAQFARLAEILYAFRLLI